MCCCVLSFMARGANEAEKERERNVSVHTGTLLHRQALCVRTIRRSLACTIRIFYDSSTTAFYELGSLSQRHSSALILSHSRVAALQRKHIYMHRMLRRNMFAVQRSSSNRLLLAAAASNSLLTGTWVFVRMRSMQLFVLFSTCKRESGYRAVTLHTESYATAPIGAARHISPIGPHAISECVRKPLALNYYAHCSAARRSRTLTSLDTIYIGWFRCNFRVCSHF